MKTPSHLYRYRPLDDNSFERELDALRNSYLYSPSFKSMNDPMEAFYQTGHPSDWIINSLLVSNGKSLDEIYKMVSETIDRFALISFSDSHQFLPMWAYYSSNFAGMCLEFDVVQLSIGDLQNENLRPVTYAFNALPPLTIADIGDKQLREKIIERITRKREEWAHEKEWRFITGSIGAKHYLDDALVRVFLGPKINPIFTKRICEILDRRAVEVLQGEINGFDMSFRCIKPARQLNECERVVDYKFDSSVLDSFKCDLEKFLKVPFTKLIEECQRIALRPNIKELSHADVSTNDRSTMYISTIYELRSGREVYHKTYFDDQFRSITKTP